MARIVVLSDIHLSPTLGFFWENWCVAREFADAAKADAVIVNGDLAINGPHSDAEIAFAATAQIRRPRGCDEALERKSQLGDSIHERLRSLSSADDTDGHPVLLVF